MERWHVALRRRKAARALQRNTYDSLVDGAHLGPQLAAEVLVRQVKAAALALAQHDQLYTAHAERRNGKRNGARARSPPK